MTKSGHRRTGAQRLSGGFSLVETVLALLVASVGLTAVMALIPYAMTQGKKSSDDTFAAFLADATFASMRTAAESRKVKWDDLNTYVSIAPVTISTPAYGTDVFWKNSKSLAIVANGQINTQVLTAASTREKWANKSSWPLPSTWEQYDHALRYRLSISNLSPRLKSLRLEVWPGEFGPVATTNATVFYTELFNHGL